VKKKKERLVLNRVWKFSKPCAPPDDCWC